MVKNVKITNVIIDLYKTFSQICDLSLRFEQSIYIRFAYIVRENSLMWLVTLNILDNFQIYFIVTIHIIVK